MNDKEIIVMTGPSGSGKTTMAYLLRDELGATIPLHCTTRKRRKDDIDNFYRYLSHDEFDAFLKDDLFMIASGDSNIVSKENGNFYGVLYDDCMRAFLKSNSIIVFASYKDIYRLELLKDAGFNIKIINLTFSDIESGVKSRIEKNPMRDHSSKDVENRIKSAYEDNLRYGDEVSEASLCNIFTDLVGIEETLNIIISSLKKNKSKKLVLENKKIKCT